MTRIKDDVILTDRAHREKETERPACLGRAARFAFFSFFALSLCFSRFSFSRFRTGTNGSGGGGGSGGGEGDADKVEGTRVRERDRAGTGECDREGLAVLIGLGFTV